MQLRILLSLQRIYQKHLLAVFMGVKQEDVLESFLCSRHMGICRILRYTFLNLKCCFQAHSAMCCLRVLASQDRKRQTEAMMIMILN